MEFKKTVWAYLIQNGLVVTGDYSFFRSGYEKDTKFYGGYLEWCKKPASFTKDTIVAMIKSKGVDWDKTLVPTREINSDFKGILTDAIISECLRGELYFKDGTHISIGAKDVNNAMLDYYETFLDLVEIKRAVADIFGQE